MKKVLKWFASPRVAAPPPLHNAPQAYGLETPLCCFSNDPRDIFTIRHAAEGIQVFGSSGSGKSTGSGKHLALALLQSGASGLVLTVKGDEPHVWKEYCAQTGRLNDLVVF